MSNQCDKKRVHDCPCVSGSFHTSTYDEKVQSWGTIAQSSSHKVAFVFHLSACLRLLWINFYLFFVVSCRVEPFLFLVMSLKMLMFYRSQNPNSAKNQAKKVLNQTQTRVREHVQYESTPQQFENHLHDLESCYGIFPFFLFFDRPRVETFWISFFRFFSFLRR